MAENNNQPASDLEKDDIGIDLSQVDKNAEENKPLFTALGQRDHWREKAKKLGEQSIDPGTGKSYKELYDEAQKKLTNPVQSDQQPKPNAPANEQPKPEQGSQDLPIKEVLRLRSEGYSEAEILEIAEQANSMKVSVTQLLGNEIFKKGIEAKRQQEKVNQTTPGPSQRAGFASKAKSIKDLKTPAERQAKFDELKKGKRSSESE